VAKMMPKKVSVKNDNEKRQNKVRSLVVALKWIKNVCS